MKAKINKLNDIEYRNPFTVPENYFATISDKIMAELPHKEVPQPIKVTMWDKVKPWIYMAAMFVGIYFSIQLLHKKTPIIFENQYNNNNAIMAGDSYWSNVQVSEVEFYEYLEEQLVNDGYYDYMYNQVSN